MLNVNEICFTVYTTDSTKLQKHLDNVSAPWLEEKTENYTKSTISDTPPKHLSFLKIAIPLFH